MKRPVPDEREVLRLLEEEAQRQRRERYPGDLMADIRPRLMERRARTRRAWPWLLPAAAALLAAVWLTQRRPPPPLPPERPEATPQEASPSAGAAGVAQAPGLSPFHVVRLPATRPPRLPSLTSAGVPSVGAALGRGSQALSQVRPPTLMSPNQEE